MCVVVTAAAAAEKMAEEDPAAMVIDAGSVNISVPLDRLTMAPPVGAAAESATVQLVCPPASIVVGVH